jgi:hypothetical protein
LIYTFTKFKLIGISSSIDSTFERAPRPLLLNATPLLEERWDLGFQAPISNIHKNEYNQSMTTYTRKQPTYKETLELIRQLPLRDQRRLRAELAKMTSVKLVHPSRDPKAIRSARLLAAKVRKKVQSATGQQSVDDAMQQLRGRSWS